MRSPPELPQLRHFHRGEHNSLTTAADLISPLHAAGDPLHLLAADALVECRLTQCDVSAYLRRRHIGTSTEIYGHTLVVHGTSSCGRNLEDGCHAGRQSA